VNKTYNCDVCNSFFDPEDKEKMDELYGISIAYNGNRQRCPYEESKIHICSSCIKGIIRLFYHDFIDEVRC
jgi:hypothetical protein